MTALGGSKNGKTRTTTSHGPTSNKKSFKASSFKPNISTKPSSNSSTTSKLDIKNAFNNKRKVDEIGISGSNSKSVEVQGETEKRVIINSLLNAPDEIDFPRGGGTSLTQIEVKEAQLEGSREAMQDDEVVKVTADLDAHKSKAKRRKLERESGVAILEKNIIPKDAFRVEHLNYKRLVPTTKVLGQVILIRPLEIIVSLPNQLLGHIPITNVTAEYTARLEAVQQDESDSEYEEAVSENDIPGLEDLFFLGQWLSCIVINAKPSAVKSIPGSREGDENVRASRRIELSTEPEKLNEGIARADLKTGFTLSASVRSIEDHGYVLSLGLQSLTSFVTFQDAQKLQARRLQIGQLVTCRVKEMGENGRTCTVTLGRGEIIGSSLSSATSITSILPSTLVTALVTATLTSGLNVKFLGYFSGTIDLFHLNNSQDPLMDYKVGQKVKARIIWDSLDSGTSGSKKFALSLNKSVLNLDESRISSDDLVTASRRLVDEFFIGRVLEQVTVSRVDEEWGLTCVIEEGDVKATGFVHISKVTDDHLATLPRGGPWRIGTLHRARVIGFSAVDGLVQLSLQPSILGQSFLRVEDVKVGAIIKGIIKRLTDSAMFVSISGNVDGVVWPLHYSDITLKHPEKKFKVGASIKARILSADPVKNRVALTLRRQLIASELPIVACTEDAQIGVITHAVVTKIMEKGLLVDFYGGVRALIPASEAAESYTADLASIFTIGRIILVRIIALEPETSRIIASARQVGENSAQASMISTVEVGDVVFGEVAALHESNLVILIQPSQVKALMSYSTLARHRKISVEALKLALVKGQDLKNLVVVSKNPIKGIVIVGMVPSKIEPTSGATGDETDTSTLSFESLVVGQILTGRICGKLPTGILVQLSRGIRGRVCKTEIADDFDLTETAKVSIGASVSCIILSVDKDNRRVELSLRSSRVEGTTSLRDPVVGGLTDLEPGQLMRGFIRNIANHGLFVSLGPTVTARVQIKELFDEYVKDWQSRFVVGQILEGKITLVDKLQNQVELSLRKNGTIKDSAIDISKLKKGQEVSGLVRKVEAYGAFIRIDGTNLSGLCHKSKVTDDLSTAWTEFVHEGDIVRAIIIDVNTLTGKISLGLSRSFFNHPPIIDHDKSIEVANDTLSLGSSEPESEDAEEDLDYENTYDGENSSESIVDTNLVRQIPKIISTSSVSNSASLEFNWDGEEPSVLASRLEPDSDDDIVHAALNPTPFNQTTQSRDLTGDLDKQVPTSASDFERLLLASPNSSYLWIQFIAFYLGIYQVDEARQIAHRALKTINFREELEKLNIWVALLNLENTYGTSTSLQSTFQDAVRANDGKTIHLKLIDIYERSAKFEAEEELFRKMTKKYGSSSKVWTLFGQFYLNRGKFLEARDLLPRALKSLEKRKHVKTISRFAQLEFKLGDAERGRTIFEGIMDNYPKKLDLWFVYVDMEVKQKNMNGVRALFDRILVQKLSSKKGKSLFKKWLSLEKEYGDIAGIESCKAKALAFVESLEP